VHTSYSDQQLQEDIESNSAKIDDEINEPKKIHTDQSNKLGKLLEENNMKLKEVESTPLRQKKGTNHRRARCVLPNQARFKILSCLISKSSKNREFYNNISISSKI
jgi:hypothetical protein